jgi:DNA ligase-associated metallophosphoesterase
MSLDARLELRGEELWLLPERAVYWPARRALIIADPHFGKAAAFRAGGVAVPGGTTAAMLRRLDATLDRAGAIRLIVLGDLLHARAGRAPHTLDEVAAWRAARPGLTITLVRGNHDRRAGDPPAEWRVECLDAPVVEPPFVWLHEPVAQAVQLASERASQPGQVELQGYPICGHVHPAVALSGNGRALTLPCFYFGRDCGLLPAFGEFTGTAVVRPRVGERVFVLAGGEIIEK